MRVTLKEYLLRLEVEELDKAEEDRRRIPELQELAEAAGVSIPTISRLANNHTRRIDMDVIEAIIEELRDRGFDTTVCDVLQHSGKDEPASLEAALVAA